MEEAGSEAGSGDFRLLLCWITALTRTAPPTVLSKHGERRQKETQQSAK